MSSTTLDPATVATLVPVATLLGQWLLRELTVRDLALLRRPEVMQSLTALGIQPLAAGDDPALLDQLAAEFYAGLITPRQSSPLVQSLYEEGRYEGQAAHAVRALAAAAGLKHAPAVARGAAVDHIGSLIVLWSQLVERWPAGAAHLAQRHLRWAHEPLRQLAAQQGFYGQLAHATERLLAELGASDPG